MSSQPVLVIKKYEQKFWEYSRYLELKVSILKIECSLGNVGNTKRNNPTLKTPIATFGKVIFQQITNHQEQILAKLIKKTSIYYKIMMNWKIYSQMVTFYSQIDKKTTWNTHQELIRIIKSQAWEIQWTIVTNDEENVILVAISLMKHPCTTGGGYKIRRDCTWLTKNIILRAYL